MRQSRQSHPGEHSQIRTFAPCEFTIVCFGPVCSKESGKVHYIGFHNHVYAPEYYKKVHCGATALTRSSSPLSPHQRAGSPTVVQVTHLQKVTSLVPATSQLGNLAVEPTDSCRCPVPSSRCGNRAMHLRLADTAASGAGGRSLMNIA